MKRKLQIGQGCLPCFLMGIQLFQKTPENEKMVSPPSFSPLPSLPSPHHLCTVHLIQILHYYYYHHHHISFIMLTMMTKMEEDPHTTIITTT